VLPGDRDNWQLVGRMPSWEKADRVTSWWGGMYAGDPWTLTVIHPRFEDRMASERSLAIANWEDRAFMQRMSVIFAIVLGVLGAGVWTAAFFVTGLGWWLLLAVVGCVPLSLASSATASLLRARREGPPAEVAWRPGVNETVWGLVRHLNSYRNAAPETKAAVRALLWALAHTEPGHPEHDVLIRGLADDLRGWDEHDAETLHTAATRLWATIPQHVETPGPFRAA
jgi:hypothetical protein